MQEDPLVKRKLAVLGAVVAVVALFAARIPSVKATDPESDTFVVTYTACTTGAGCTADAAITAGEPVTTNVHTSLDSVGGSFYDQVQTVFAGVGPSGAVSPGESVGTGDFSIYSASGHPCTTSDTHLVPPITTYTIYQTGDTNPATYPSLGYAKGLSAAENWSTFATAGWIQDFDDDNNNNKPDSTESPVPAGDALAQTVQDLAVGNGVPDGVDREPLYLPVLDALIGETHTSRYFGVAKIIPTVVEVPVDFLSYAGIPAAGQTTQLAVISEGGGVGLLPADPTNSGSTTCIPFNSNITINAISGASHVVQTVTGDPDWKFQFSTTSDWDGDGLPQYMDNCDAVYNPAQTDADGDGIGVPCDTNDASADAADADSDGFANFADSCPYQKSIVDSDSDGIANVCDPASAVVGDGHGYGSPAGGTGYTDHDIVREVSTTLASLTSCAGPAGCSLGSASSASITDSNDNHVADSAETAGESGGQCTNAADDDGDGVVNDGCAAVATAESGANCFNAVDDDSDGTVNDGCPSWPLLGSGLASGDSDGDGTLDGADANALDANTNGDRTTKCGSDCQSLTYTFALTPSTRLMSTSTNNMVGDGCNDSDEIGLGNGFPAVIGSLDQWMFYDVPVPALFSAANPKAVYRTSGVLSGGMAQAVFGYAKKGSKLGTLEYNQDLNQNNVMDGVEYDRTTVAGVAYAGPPDGVITGTDAQKAFAQVKLGLKCNTGGYKLNDHTTRP
jgi:hypothetical protein